jgi:hypothetical protein
MQNNSRSLIDLALSNDTSMGILSGTLITDISDHFPIFIQPRLSKHKNKPAVNSHRLLNNNNMTNFRNDLANLTWNNVLRCNDVNESYEMFWADFKCLYDLHFPVVTVRFNKNYHKINDFMTTGLVTSRRTKNRLLQITLNDPCENNIKKYREFRNLYYKLIRVSKKMHYSNNLNVNAKNPKKTWEILRELTSTKKCHEKIEKICTPVRTLMGDQDMANEFNNFFSSVGRNISDSVVPLQLKKPEDFIPNRELPYREMEFENRTQAEFIMYVWAALAAGHNIVNQTVAVAIWQHCLTELRQAGGGGGLVCYSHYLVVRQQSTLCLCPTHPPWMDI